MAEYIVTTCSECDKPLKAKGYCSTHLARFKRNGHPGYVRAVNGGGAKHPNYRSFAGMKRRCHDKRSNRYSLYGARGIKVCDRWMEPQGFWNFVTDMGIRPSKGYSLDRIDVNADYSPSNCRWATVHQQTANRQYNAEVVGVNKHSGGKGWCAMLMVGRTRHYLGYFTDYRKAVTARREAEEKYGIR